MIPMSSSSVRTDTLRANARLRRLLTEVLGAPEDAVTAVVARADQLLPQFRVIVWEGDPETFQFTYVSPATEKVLGYPTSRWLREPSFWTETVVHPDDRNAAVTYCALATGRGLDHDFAYRARTADGRIIMLHDTVQVIKGPRKIATRLRGVMIDVTHLSDADPADDRDGVPI